MGVWINRTNADHPLFRDALKQTLAGMFPGSDINVAGSLEELTVEVSFWEQELGSTLARARSFRRTNLASKIRHGSVVGLFACQ